MIHSSCICSHPILYFYASFLICGQGFLAAQGLPETDIYIGDISYINGMPVVDSLTNITHRAGYDNQPSFTPDGKSILFTEYLDTQSDIFRYDLTGDSIVRVTQTKESEYSPRVMPDGKNFSVVRVELDSAQRVWRFPLIPRSIGPELLLKTIKPVGYQAWIDSVTIAVFVLGDTNSLHVVDIPSERDEKVIGEIGRTLHKVSNQDRSASFIHKVSEKEWWVKEYNLNTKSIRPIIKTLPGREDFAPMPDGTLLMGDSSRIYFWKPGTSPAWQLLSDFSPLGISQITRIAVNAQGDRIAVVAVVRPKE
jgi:hypothetical protein